MPSAELHIRFAGQELILNAEGVLYWPQERTLIASDLHFEKATFLARHGAMLPPYDTLDTLLRLEKLIERYAPQRLILLGDSFHDRDAWERIDAPLRARILALSTRVDECIWIEGNHDSGLHSHTLGTLTGGMELGGIHLRHEASVAHRPSIIGHYHPKAHIFLGKRSARGKCFIHCESLMVMPSFGSYTGGLDIRHEAIRTLFTSAPQAYLLYGTNIYRVPA